VSIGILRVTDVGPSWWFVGAIISFAVAISDLLLFELVSIMILLLFPFLDLPLFGVSSRLSSPEWIIFYLASTIFWELLDY